MIIRNEEQLNELLELGNIAANILKQTKEYTIPGRLTREVDEFAKSLMEKWGVESAPVKEYNFPGSICISINQVVAHGVPSAFIIGPGDIVNLDVSITRNGLYVDMGESFGIAPIKLATKKLISATKQAYRCSLDNIRVGNNLNMVAKGFSRGKGKFNAIRNLASHGIGSSLHEEPGHILGVFDPNETRVFEEGQVVAIEPYLTSKGDLVVENGQWELIHPDRNAISAQYEHTLVVTKTRPIVVTSLRTLL